MALNANLLLPIRLLERVAGAIAAQSDCGNRDGRVRVLVDSMAVVEQAIKAARGFRPMSQEQTAALLARTAQAAEDGKYERYKTSHLFDATYNYPQPMG